MRAKNRNVPSFPKLGSIPWAQLNPHGVFCHNGYQLAKKAFYTARLGQPFNVFWQATEVEVFVNSLMAIVA